MPIHMKVSSVAGTTNKTAFFVIETVSFIPVELSQIISHYLDLPLCKSTLIQGGTQQSKILN